MIPADPLYEAIAALDSNTARAVLGSGAVALTDDLGNVPWVTMGCFVAAGSRDEAPEEAGVGHFLEHLLFRGTEHRSARELNRAIDRLGGDLNAYTSRERIVVYTRLPAAAAEAGWELLAELVVAPALREDDVEIERHVILEELEAALDDPDDLVGMKSMETAFGDHPMAREVIGSAESVAALSADAARAAHARWFQPANMVWAGAGAIDHDWLCERVEGLAGSGTRPTRRPPEWPAASVESRVVRPVEQTHFEMTWWAPDLDDPDRYALAVLNHLLGDGPSSALYEQIREERGLAYSVGSSVSAYTDISMLAVGCTMAPRHEATVRALIAEVTQKFCDGTISESDTSDAIGYLSGSLVMDLEDSGARMARLGSSELARGRLSELREAYERLKAVTPHDVKRVAHRVFSTPSVTSVVGPS